MKILFENWQKYLSEERSIHQIYCDMDGVLVDFEKAASERITDDLRNDKAPELLDSIGRDYVTPADLSGIPKVKDYMKKTLGNNEEFWTSLEWMPDGEELWDFIAPYNPYILTSPMRAKEGPGSENGKRTWVETHLQPPPEKVFVADNKYRWAVVDGKPNILIDDFRKNTVPWDNVQRDEGMPELAILHRSTEQTIERLKELLNLG